jgi:cell division protein FtsW (lipid II flippase)
MHFLTRQIIYAFLGTLVLIVAAMIPIRIWKDNSRVVILLAIFLMMLVFLPAVGRSAVAHNAGLKFYFSIFSRLNFQKSRFVCIYRTT